MTIQYEIKEYTSLNKNDHHKAIYAENKNGKKDGYLQNNDDKRKLTREELKNMLTVNPNKNPFMGYTLLDIMNKHLMKPKPILYKNATKTVASPNKSSRRTRHQKKDKNQNKHYQKKDKNQNKKDTKKKKPHKTPKNKTRRKT